MGKRVITYCHECKYAKPLPGHGGVYRCMHTGKSGFSFTRRDFKTCYRFEKGKFNPAEFESGPEIDEEGRVNA